MQVRKLQAGATDQNPHHFTVGNGIISIYSNSTDNIIKKIVNV